METSSSVVCFRGTDFVATWCSAPVDKAAAEDDAIVLVASGLPESRDIGVLLNPALSEYLLSPVTVYGLRPEAAALTFEPGVGGAAYVELVVNERIDEQRQVVVISRVAQGFADYGVVVAAGLADEGFSVVARPNFTGLNVTMLQRG